MNIPVIFSINKSYLTPVTVVIKSIIDNSASNFDFYILSTTLEPSDEEQLRQFVISNSPNSNMTVINMKPYINQNLEHYMSRRKHYNHISCETYFRFYIPELFQEYKKVIYLDSDILVFDDLKKIFDVDISGKYAAVVKDIWNRKGHHTDTRPHLSFEAYFNEIIGVKSEDYFNAGVLVLNLTLIRKKKLYTKFWDFAYENSPLEFQDQDVLNAVFNGNVYYLETRWNLLKDFEDIYSLSKDLFIKKELDKARRNPGIVHYVGFDKPWKITTNSYSYIIEWWETFSKTGLLTHKDKVQFNKIKTSSHYKIYKPFFVFKIGTFDILHIYRCNFRYFVYLMGILVFRKTIKNRTSPEE